MVVVIDLGDRLDFMMVSLSGIEIITEEGEEGDIGEEAKVGVEVEVVITSMKEEEGMVMIMEVIDEEGEEEVVGIEMMMDTEEVETEEEEVVVEGRVVKKDEPELHHGMQQWVMVMELLLCHHRLARYLHLPRPLIEPFMYVYSIIIMIIIVKTPNVILCCSFLKR